MNPGQFNRRVTVQQKSVTRAANGEEVVAWQDVATVWASVDMLKGNEIFAAAQMLESVDYRVRIRYRADVDREMRILAGTVTLDIVAAIMVGNYVALELLCRSGVRNAR